MIIVDKNENLMDIEITNIEFIGEITTIPIVISYHYGMFNNIGHMLTTIKIYECNKVVNSQTTLDNLSSIPEKRKRSFIRSLLDEFESLMR